MKYECECCGKEIERSPLTCSDKCRMSLVRNPNKKSDNTQESVRKENKLADIVQKTNKKIKEIRYDNPFQICKKHNVYKRSCGCK